MVAGNLLAGDRNYSITLTMLVGVWSWTFK